MVVEHKIWVYLFAFFKQRVHITDPAVYKL